jgi:hypothetical protein
MLLIVGRGGMTRLGFNKMSFLRSLDDVSTRSVRGQHYDSLFQACSEDINHGYLGRAFPAEDISSTCNDRF